MALAMIEGAEACGDLRPGMRVVEFTGGSTGSSLGMLSAAKRCRFVVLSSVAFAKEQLLTMKAFGTDLRLVPSDGGRVTPALFGRFRTVMPAMTAGHAGAHRVEALRRAQFPHTRRGGRMTRHERSMKPLVGRWRDGSRGRRDPCRPFERVERRRGREHRAGVWAWQRRRCGRSGLRSELSSRRSVRESTSGVRLQPCAEAGGHSAGWGACSAAALGTPEQPMKSEGLTLSV